jgi:trehalose 6-phosphate phosphatase
VLAAAEDLRSSAAVRASGAHLEDKEYAIAVHTRRTHDPDSWAGPINETVREIARRHGLEVIPGKLVWELAPQVHADKGDAVRRVIAESGARSVVVIGDDLGDLPAFNAVPPPAAQGHDGLRVAVRSSETPPPLLAQADLIVDGPPGALDFLQRLTA